MSIDARFRFLGTGASMGVPVIGCSCQVCKSTKKENRRLRSSGLFLIGDKRILLDAGPDFREQALTHKLHDLDGVIFTHTHYDHSGGLDDLRIYYFRTHEALPCLLSQSSYNDLRVRHAYLFSPGENGSNVAAKLDFRVIETLPGDVNFLDTPFRVFKYDHGNMEVVGYRIGDFAYVTDIFDYTDAIFDELKGLKTLVLSALRPSYSHVHFTLQKAEEFAGQVGAEMTYFTHAAHDIEHFKTNSELPENMQFAYDGLEVAFSYD